MARPCAVCHHEEREHIDALLRSGMSVDETWAELAEGLGGFSLSSLTRHARSHVGGRTPLADVQLPGEDVADLLAGLVDLRAQQAAIARNAAARGAHGIALRAGAEARQTSAVLLDRIGADADTITERLTGLTRLLSTIRRAVLAAPAEAQAWADAFESAGVAPDLAEDIRNATRRSTNA